MRGMSAHQLEEYKNRFEKYKFEPIKANDFTGFVWGSVDENRGSSSSTHDGMMA
jgi:hypothetical protein